MDDGRRATEKDLNDGRFLKPGEKVFDLIDVIEDVDIEEGHIVAPAAGERKIHDLVDAIDEQRQSPVLNAEMHEELVKGIAGVAEKIARELVPEIAERVIREEIEKLKKEL